MASDRDSAQMRGERDTSDDWISTVIFCVVSLVFGVFVGAGLHAIRTSNIPNFYDGVRAAARGEWSATHVALPDGTERWIVTRTTKEPGR